MSEQKMREALDRGDWVPCVKKPVVVYVRKQKIGELHVSTREGLTPLRPDDLIMRGVKGEEYPIGSEIFEETYVLGEALAQSAEVVADRAQSAELAKSEEEQKPVLVIRRGEVCYFSTEDDQSYGMYCPVTPEYNPGLPDGTNFYTSPPAAPVVPAGWKLVPVEPTPEMMVSAQKADHDHGDHDEWLEFEGGDVKRVYRAMLAATPEPRP